MDKGFDINNLALHENEIRISKGYSTSTGYEVFRMFEDNIGNWKAELYKTYAHERNDTIKTWIRRTNLTSFKNLKLIWLEIIFNDVLYLPEWEDFEYKLHSQEFEPHIIDGEIVYYKIQNSILDGVTYKVMVKSGDEENQFIYYNPESYWNKYPHVDELKCSPKVRPKLINY